MTKPSPSLSSSPIEAYFDRIHQLLKDLRSDESGSIGRAADLLQAQIARDRPIFVFGAGGHSVIGTEEMFWRAGGLACVSPLFDASLLLSGGGRKSTMLERVPGIGDKVVAASDLAAGDVLIITSIYGMNAATIDAALEAKGRGAALIAITSIDHARNTPADFPARHPSRTNLFELADVTIDNHVPHGDVLVEIEGCSQKTGASSTILVSACVQWLVLETVARCQAAGILAPVWQSANTPGGDTANASYLDRFSSRIKAL